MYWNWLTILLLVFACIFFVIGLLYLPDIDEGAPLFFGVLCAVCVFLMFLVTDIHAGGGRDKRAKAALRAQGFDVLSADADGKEATVRMGVCEVNTDMEKNQGRWKLYLNREDGTRVLLTPSSAERVSAACRI